MIVQITILTAHKIGLGNVMTFEDMIQIYVSFLIDDSFLDRGLMAELTGFYAAQRNENPVQ